MILTVTLNPSVDMNYQLDDFTLDTANRVEDVSKTAGGKGLNVANVLRQLGQDAAATGFLGGELGDFISKRIQEKGIRDDFVSIHGHTRNCIAIIQKGQQTEILEGGPNISQEEAGRFLSAFREKVDSVQLVTVSGSHPKGLPADFYHSLLAICEEAHKPVLLDTKGSLLKTTLEAGASKPYMIKPNEDELADVMGKPVHGAADIKKALADPLFAGIPWIIVSLGADGAVVKQDDSFYSVQAPKIEAVNPVGSGDSVVAGFAAAMERGLEGEARMTFALAMGVLNAMEAKTGNVDPAKIEWCLDQMRVETLA